MTDPTRFRQRRVRDALVLRSRALSAIRAFFIESGYLEVETPILVPAPAPEAHIDALPFGSGFAHTSPELCMKRLLAAGFERIFQICKCFRRNERGGRHLPELTLLEWYTAGHDYSHMMRQCEALFLSLASRLGRPPRLTYQGRAIDLRPEWERLSVEQAFARYGSLPLGDALAAGRFDEIMGLEIEPLLGWGRPVFLYDYPAACGALARPKEKDAGLVERFELYIGGLELCNAFSELTDPAEQRRRFEKELADRKKSGKTVYPMPEPFLHALEFMPQCAGNALGVDRLVMLLADADRIDEVVAFIPEEL